MRNFFLSFITGLGISLGMGSSANAILLKNYRVELSARGEKTVQSLQFDGRSKKLSLSAPEFFDSSGFLIAQLPENTGSYAARVIKRDYQIDQLLPSTGQTTILNLTKHLNDSEKFAPCPENSQLIEFAESTHFLVQICLQETANDSTVFWMGYAKDGRGSLTLEIDQNFEFWNFDTYYAIERRPLGENSYLLIGWPNGTIDAEALLYYYYPCFRDNC